MDRTTQHVLTRGVVTLDDGNEREGYWTDDDGDTHIIFRIKKNIWIDGALPAAHLPLTLRVLSV